MHVRAQSQADTGRANTSNVPNKTWLSKVRLTASCLPKGATKLKSEMQENTRKVAVVSAPCKPGTFSSYRSDALEQLLSMLPAPRKDRHSQKFQVLTISHTHQDLDDG